MNTAKYVDEQIPLLKGSGIPLSAAAWEAAKLCIGWPYIFGDWGQYCTPSQRRSVYNAHPDQEGLVSQCQVLKGTKGSCGGCKWYPEGQRVRSFDCRGFTYWILLQIYGWKLIGAGCTSQWNTETNWKAKGSIESVPQDRLVCLFYRNKKNPSVMQHTGFYYKGETIECGNGVQYSKTLNKKWEYWAMPACIEGDAPDPGPEPVKRPTLRKGDRGVYVTLAQQELIRAGFSCGPKGADGIFGTKTAEAVVAFQKANGLKADAIIGRDTWAALDQAAAKDPPAEAEKPEAEERYTVTIPGLTKEQAEELCGQWSGATKTNES